MDLIEAILVEKERLEKDGFDFTVYEYKANAHFPDGSCLKRVYVIGQLCYSISKDNKNVLIFKHKAQEKGFRLEKLYET